MVLDARGGYAPGGASLRLPDASIQLSSLAIGMAGSGETGRSQMSPHLSGGGGGEGRGWGGRSREQPQPRLACPQRVQGRACEAQGPEALPASPPRPPAGGHASLVLPAEQSLALSRLNMLTGADVSLILPPSHARSGGGVGAEGATISLVPSQLPVIAPVDLAAEYEGSRMVLEPSASELELVAELAGEAEDTYAAEHPDAVQRAPVSASRLRVQQMSQQLVDIAAALSPGSASMLLDNNASMVVPVLPTSICARAAGCWCWVAGGSRHSAVCAGVGACCTCQARAPHADPAAASPALPPLQTSTPSWRGPTLTNGEPCPLGFSARLGSRVACLPSTPPAHGTDRLTPTCPNRRTCAALQGAPRHQLLVHHRQRLPAADPGAPGLPPAVRRGTPCRKSPGRIVHPAALPPGWLQCPRRRPAALPPPAALQVVGSILDVHYNKSDSDVGEAASSGLGF